MGLSCVIGLGGTGAGTTELELPIGLDGTGAGTTELEISIGLDGAIGVDDNGSVLFSTGLNGTCRTGVMRAVSTPMSCNGWSVAGW